MDYLIPIAAANDREITVEIEQCEDNLFLRVNGVPTGISLWFTGTEDDELLVSLGSASQPGNDTGWWREQAVIPIPKA